MAESYYPNDEEGTEPSDNPQEESQEGDEQQDSDGYESFLVPKSAFPDMKPGDKEEVQCLHEYEDELEMKCSKGSDKSKSPAMDEAMDSMDEMASTDNQA